MVLEISLDDFNPERHNIFADPKPGRAHVVATDWEELAVRGEWHRLRMEIVAHDDPGEVGKNTSELFHAGSRSQWRLILLALALRLTTVDELNAKKESGEPLVLDIEKGLGRSFFVRFVKEKDPNGETRIRINQNLFSIDDPRCTGWPRNEKIIEREQQQGDSDDAAADVFGL